MKTSAFLIILVFAFSNITAQRLAPAYPLITHDPYFSIWSFSDKLNESPTKHWTGRDHSLVGLIKVDGQVYNFLGGLPKESKVIVSTGELTPYSAKYTESKPGADWTNPEFDDSQWMNGSAPFGTTANGAATPWDSKEIWVRREFVLDSIPREELVLSLRHDDGVEVYINGSKAYDCSPCWLSSYENKTIPEAARKKLKKGKNVIAMHCTNTAGNAWLDAGLTAQWPVQGFKNAIQKNVALTATQTSYSFTCGPVDLSVNFLSPLLMNDLELLSQPISYIEYSIRSNDSKEHRTEIYFGASTDIAVNTRSQQVHASVVPSAAGTALRAGTVEQPVLAKKGDNLRIDWGHMYLMSADTAAWASIGSYQAFRDGNSVAALRDSIGYNMYLGITVSKGSGESLGVVALGYDDSLSVEYFTNKLQPWWRRKGVPITELMTKGLASYPSIKAACDRFDSKMYSDAVAAGGKNYAHLCVLGYRQSIAAHKLVMSPDNKILFLSKENFSNGSINTVDVTYPSAPLFLLYNPELLKGMLNGIFYYSESGKWTKPFAAHDLGTYPIANGQTYPEDMPVEECGNMIILTAAICNAEKSTEYAKEHWTTLNQWAEYLAREGLDPANQLCTDDFAGHLARNANLSVKAIVALGAFAKMAGNAGEPETAARYAKLARSFVTKWIQMARDGSNFSLAFGKRGTWSQKYNLVWDKLLDLDLFPEEVYKKEIAHYLTKQKRFGLPLDNRKTYTKSDWIVWTATLTDKPEEFRAFVDPVYNFALRTRDRVPLTDWHETTTGEQVGFQARSVVGGYFIKMLWEEWK
jgi:hypothetical protein